MGTGRFSPPPGHPEARNEGRRDARAPGGRAAPRLFLAESRSCRQVEERRRLFLTRKSKGSDANWEAVEKTAKATTDRS